MYNGLVVLTDHTIPIQLDLFKYRTRHGCYLPYPVVQSSVVLAFTRRSGSSPDVLAIAPASRLRQLPGVFANGLNRMQMHGESIAGDNKRDSDGLKFSQ